MFAVSFGAAARADDHTGIPKTGAYQVHVVDVGTGLATIIEGRDFIAVYDGGSNDDLARGAKNRLVAYLKLIRPDLDTINHVILSHPHRDHVELLPDVFDSYTVENAWDSGRPFAICGYRYFLTKISDSGVTYHDAVEGNGSHRLSFKAQTCYGKPLPKQTISVREGDKIGSAPVALGDGASMTFLYANGVPDENPNENSLVVMFALGSARVLFMGDAQAGERGDPADAPAPKSVEGQLLDCCTRKLRADLMIVGHHGSRTSSRDALLDAVGAKLFAVSSGPTKYGPTVTLPDKVVIDDLKARGEVFRTDVSDAKCKLNAHKVGPDKDGRPGGCTNIVFSIASDGDIVEDTWSAED